MSKKRQWKEDYISYGFTCTIEKDGTQRPQCILCCKIFSNSNLKPSKLLEHFNNQHGGEGAGHTISTLKSKRARFDSSGTIISFGSRAVQKPLLEASYQVAYLCAKKKKPHTVAEELIKPCALEMVKIILGSDAEKKIQQVPLSNDVIRSRIQDISHDILLQVIQDIKTSPLKISIQLDESTDVENCCQLLVYVRYVKDREIVEEFLFCETLELTARGIDVFNYIKEFFRKYEIPMDVIGSICTDGAPSMIGKNSGFVAYMKKEIPHITVTHCMLHRHALASKTLPVNLKQTLSTAISVVNYIRGRALNHRIFRSFCEEIGAAHTVLLYHTEVRWLSKGRMLSRVFEMHKEIIQFLTQQSSSLLDDFARRQFILRLAYLSDIFTHLNELNRSMQGFGKNIITAREKLSAFIEKLKIWKRRAENCNFANFPALDEIVLANEKITISLDVTVHLQQLSESFHGYFSPGDVEPEQRWILDPFLFDLRSINDSNLIKDELVEIRNNSLTKMEFAKMELEQFWCNQLLPFPQVANTALQILIPFATTYLCEMGFSSLLHIKTKARNRLNASDDMRVAISKKEPRFKDLIIKKQQQNSH